MYYDRIWNECRDDFKREFQRLWQKRENERNGNFLIEIILNKIVYLNRWNYTGTPGNMDIRI